MRSRQEIAEQVLGEMLGQAVSLAEGGFAPCPGRQHHSKGDGKKDFRIVLDGAPTGYCFHTHCGAEVDAFNKEMRRRIWFEENGRSPVPRGHWGEGVAAAPKEELKSRPEIDREAIAERTRGVPAVDRAWFRRRSPVDVSSVESGDFLFHLYRPDERVLIFTDQKTQGDFIAWRRGGGLGLNIQHPTSNIQHPIEEGRVETFRLSQQRGVKAVPSKLPTGAKDGVWFLAQPVTGQWEVRKDVQWDDKTRVRSVEGKYSRRSQGNVTGWRFFVLESDELEEGEWMRVLAILPFPIAAIYTSGGRSIHALVMMEVATKAEWDAVRNAMRQWVCPLGADPAALTAVRLTRLPGCKRGDRMQELIYLDPNPDSVRLILKPEQRA